MDNIMNDDNIKEISKRRLQLTPTNDDLIDDFTDALDSKINRPSPSSQPFNTDTSNYLNHQIPSIESIAQYHQHQQRQQPQPSISVSNDNNKLDNNNVCVTDEKLYKNPGWTLFRSVDVGGVFTMDVTDQDCGICDDTVEDLNCFKLDNDYLNVSSSSNTNRFLNMHLGCRSPSSASTNDNNKPRCQGQVKFKLNDELSTNDDTSNIGSNTGHAYENDDTSGDEDDKELDRESYDNEIESMLSEEEGDNTLDDTSGVIRVNKDISLKNRKQLYPNMARQLSASLPIQVPINIMKASKGYKKSHHDDLYENDDDSLSDDYNAILEDPSKIPESIEALARSVRDSTEIFGALPSRRFNTGELVRSLRLT